MDSAIAPELATLKIDLSDSDLSSNEEVSQITQGAESDGEVCEHEVPISLDKNTTTWDTCDIKQSGYTEDATNTCQQASTSFSPPNIVDCTLAHYLNEDVAIVTPIAAPRDVTLQNQSTGFIPQSVTINPVLDVDKNSTIVYPSVYVSPAGLLTVLLQHDVAVEMTTDRTIRVVNHRHRSVAATNSRGNASCIYHAVAKIYQQGTTTEADLFWDRRAKMSTGQLMFAVGPHCYTQNEDSLQITQPKFSDLSKDMSVSLLFSSSGYGPQLIPQYESIAQSAKYYVQSDGGVVIYVNGVKIQQSCRGDVTVSSRPKTIWVCPVYGSVYIETHFVMMTVEMNWTVHIKRGGHRLHASLDGMTLSDGKMKAGFDAYRQVFSYPVQPRGPRPRSLATRHKLKANSEASPRQTYRFKR